nr:uncharacterized protein LOC105490189 [Macaca nemestrina]
MTPAAAGPTAAPEPPDPGTWARALAQCPVRCPRQRCRAHYPGEAGSVRPILPAGKLRLRNAGLFARGRTQREGPSRIPPRDSPLLGRPVRLPRHGPPIPTPLVQISALWDLIAGCGPGFCRQREDVRGDGYEAWPQESP